MRLTRARAQDGFTMITTMLALFVVGLLSVAAIAAANGDIRFSRYDQDDKQAYAAAEAGLNDYFAHLQLDPDFWTRCNATTGTKPIPSGYPLNQQWSGSGVDPRTWKTMSGTNSRYTLEMIPAPGKSSCSTSDPAGSMIDSDGNFRIRATGNVLGTRNYKSVVATFRRTGFLDFLYFTDFENQDPTYLTLNYGDIATRETNSSGTPTGGPDLATWAGTNCDRHWWGTIAGGDGRAQGPSWHGQFKSGNSWTPSGGFDIGTSFVCGEIQFASDDQVNGPFHSNDDILVSGSPDFGRTTNKDRVEVANLGGTDQGWRGSGAAPNFRTASGKLTIGANTLDLPPGNTAIKAQALPAYTYTGPTDITFNGNATMNVTNNGTTTNNVAVPSNGVIYVQNSSCTFGYNPTDTKTFDSGCGVAKVKGTYNTDITVAAQDDVVVMSNLQRASGSNAVMGLVADDFVRVWHPVTRSGNGCTNDSGGPTNMKIDAAILSLKHSFTVDNYDCGAQLGNLTINGAIAQKHRGIVGTSGGSGTGYIKNYNYDDRLKYRSPPYFLDPVQASWRILRETDQSNPR